MFNNVGEKIKTVAFYLSFGGIFASIIIGVIMAMQSISLFLIAIAIIVLGSLLSWISSLFFYALGEIVDKLTILANNVPSQHKSPHASTSPVLNENGIMDIPKRNKKEEI